MKNKLMILMGVGSLVYSTSSFIPTINTQAALTPPASYTIGYRHDGGKWYLGNTTSFAQLWNPIYVRSNNTPYYNYEANWNNSYFSLIPNGVSIKVRFDNSDTGWTAGTVSGTYFPNVSTTKIGAGASAGGAFKVNITITNDTYNDYLLLVDTSSTANFAIAYIEYANYPSGVFAFGYYNQSFAYQNIVIPSKYTMTWKYEDTTAARYLDAFYLTSLGVSDAYDAGETAGYSDGFDDGYLDGFDDGYTDGLAEADPTIYDQGYEDGLNAGLTAMPIGNLFTMVFGSIASIFNIGVIGGLTFGSIIIAPIAVALVWFLLGIVSGVGSGGKKK